MEDINQEDKQSSSRYRGPTFSKEEVDILLNLIEKYKHFILNKSISSAACQAKDNAWVKIEKQFNSQVLGITRSADKLKTKWENMKRDARKLSKNVMDSSFSDIDTVSARILAMISEADNIGPNDTPHDILDDEVDSNENDMDEQKDISNGFSKHWDESIESDDDYEKRGRVSRSLNFSPQECSLLLQCVKKEKKHVFSREITKRALELKNSAWSRIAESYNKLSPEKRSAKALKTKFTSLKCLAKKTGFKDYFKDVGNKHSKHKHDKLVKDNFKRIKKEPLFEDKLEADSDPYEDTDDIDFNGHKSDNCVDVPPDPLSSVLNSDSGIGSSHLGTWNWNQLDNKEIVKLKTELLNYQMETAKLERKRVEELMQEETAARESRAIETVLRLRAARLDAVGAAMRLPPAHPALHYTPEEARAQQYLSQYHQT